MATTTVTLEGDVSDAIGGEFDASRTKVWVAYNTDKVVTDSGPIRLGSGTESINSDGTFSLANVVAATSLVENLQATVWVDYTDTAGVVHERKQAFFGPYDLSAETGTVQLRAIEAVQALDASVASQLMVSFQELLADAQALLDAQVDLSQIALPDALVEALVKNTGGVGPKTSAALLASFGHPVSTDGTDGLPTPNGVGLEFVISAAGLDDIRFEGVSL
jgi:hypothetical protein